MRQIYIIKNQNEILGCFLSLEKANESLQIAKDLIKKNESAEEEDDLEIVFSILSD